MALLDTCTLLWLAADQASLSEAAVSAISAARGMLAVSPMSAFEIALKHRRGKLGLPLGPQEWFREALATHGIRELPVDTRCAVLAATLPPIHRDPCDRFLVAAATIHQLPIITPNHHIARYPGVRTIW